MSQLTDSGLRLRFFLCGVACALLAFAGVFILFTHRLAVQAEAKAPIQFAGPWGIVEVKPLPLTTPDGRLPDHDDRMQRPRWYFENYSKTDVEQLFRKCRLRPIQWSILTDQQFWNIASNACVLTPPEPIIWSLSPRARALIYPALANCATNYAQCFPFRFPPELFEPHLRECGLSATEIEKVRRLAYTNAGTVCFTDFKALHDTLKPGDFEDLVAALYKIPAYSLRLVVTPDADVDALVKYWGTGGREKMVSPVIKGLARVPGGGSINVAQLLPAFARSRLYTFPDAWNDPNAAREDCFYAAMNFFNETADTNYLDRDFTGRVLDNEFEPVESRPTFGDRLLLLDEKGGGIHICVYVAADFVFTKNGINRAEPWVLMRMSDVLATYHVPQLSGRTVVYRHKAKPDLSAAPEELPAE
jgi:hypothetical protein